MAKLTERKIKSITRPGRYGDGHCLWLRVTPNGSRQFVQRLVVRGRRMDVGLGGWPMVSLDEARIRSLYNRKVARVYGGDPTLPYPHGIEGWAPAPQSGGPVPPPPTPTPTPTPTAKPTFEECAGRAHAAHKDTWRSAHHATNWLASLRKFVFPAIGALPVDQVTPERLLRLLEPLREVSPDKANRVRQRIGKVLDYSKAHGYVTSNATHGLTAALPAKRIKQKHMEALPYEKVAQALSDAAQAPGSAAGKLALTFLALTATRSGDVLGAQWGEMYESKALWIIPATRTKAGVEHLVPLSKAAMAVLAKAKQLDNDSGLVFPSPQSGGKPTIDGVTLRRLFRSSPLVSNEQVHGLRTAFRTWAEENTTFDHCVKEMSLAHQVGSAVERSYNRSTLVSKRRALMQAWADFLNGGGNPMGDWNTEVGALLAAGLSGWNSKQENQQQAKQAS